MQALYNTYTQVAISAFISIIISLSLSHRALSIWKNKSISTPFLWQIRQLLFSLIYFVLTLIICIIYRSKVSYTIIILNAISFWYSVFLIQAFASGSRLLSYDYIALFCVLMKHALFVMLKYDAIQGNVLITYRFINIIIMTIIIIWIAMTVSKITSYFMTFFTIKTLKQGSYNAKIYSKIVTYIVYTIAILSIFHLCGISSTQLSFATGALTLGIGIGLQKIVANFVSGLLIMTENNIKIGDRVVNPDLPSVGTVMNIGMRTTTIGLDNGNECVIPNENLIIKPLTNLTLNQHRFAIELVFVLKYPDQIQDAINAITKTASSGRVYNISASTNAHGLLYLTLTHWIEDIKIVSIASIRTAVIIEVVNILSTNSISIISNPNYNSTIIN